jgi:hypothetical protein
VIKKVDFSDWTNAVYDAFSGTAHEYPSISVENDEPIRSFEPTGPPTHAFYVENLPPGPNKHNRATMAKDIGLAAISDSMFYCTQSNLY